MGTTEMNFPVRPLMKMVVASTRMRFSLVPPTVAKSLLAVAKVAPNPMALTTKVLKVVLLNLMVNLNPTVLLAMDNLNLTVLLDLLMALLVPLMADLLLLKDMVPLVATVLLLPKVAMVPLVAMALPLTWAAILPWEVLVIPPILMVDTKPVVSLSSFSLFASDSCS